MEDANTEAILSEPGGSGLAQEVSRLWAPVAACPGQTSDVNKENPEASTLRETILPAEKCNSKSPQMLNEEQPEKKCQSDISRRLRARKSLIPEQLVSKRRIAQMRRVRLKGAEVNTEAEPNVETEAEPKVETEIKTEMVEAGGTSVATRLVLVERMSAMGTPTLAVTRVLVDEPDSLDSEEELLDQEQLLSEKERLQKELPNRGPTLEQNGGKELPACTQEHTSVSDGCDPTSEDELPMAEPPCEVELHSALLPKTEPPSPESPSPEYPDDHFMSELLLAAPIVELYVAEPPTAEPSTDPSASEPSAKPSKAKRPKTRRPKAAKRPKAKPKAKPRVKSRAKAEPEAEFQAELQADAPKRRQPILTTEALERRRQHDRDRDRSQRRMTKEQRERKRMLDRERQRHLTAEQRQRKREYDRERQLLRARLKCGEVNSERELYAMGLTEEQQERKRARERNRYRKKRGLPPIEVQGAVEMTEEQRAFLRATDLAEQNQIRLKRENQERTDTGPQEECPHCQRAFRWKTSLERHLLECGQEPNQHFLQAFLY
ncbi:histone-lysine N-methyltransferase, H3 lysine-79 specific-like [Thrips palmi]|uniref:Histone-lysine N-methyltransferase, H3 lysine-79 specific-like n=1 Tax=Thrips palmi TaxID=161013 RepID=A0A6P8ZH40_THRPL|nr:histone-lysine N-methyltransferase, H3 lysine-79 specific-like [Thrips palmi]